MTDSEPSVRRRKPDPAAATPDVAEPEDDKPKDKVPKKTKKKSRKSRLDDEDEYPRSALLLDILRVLTFLFLASCGLSYLVSSGETFFWGMSDPPKYLRPSWWSKQLSGPLYLTPAELATFDGTDETKPLYLAINGSIYDVSSNRRTYGPGGSYQFFAGCDAARAFVTGCFAEDRTPDMRGVVDMFLPLDDPVVDRHWSAAEMREMKRKEMEEAERKVEEGLAHWVNFFKNSPKYEFVGYVKKPAGWPGTEPVRKLCDAAVKGRKKRTVPEGK